MSDPTQTKRTRFVCISDTHNTYPKLPAGDVLIHAGDLTNQGSLSELRKTIDWIEKADFEVKIVVAGNHDVTLDSKFYAQYGNYFHHKDIQDPETCLSLLTDAPSITYLNHEAKVFRLTKPDGPQTTFKIFGSPYSPSRGLWGFGYAPEDASGLWEQIPLDVDVVVTHTPAKFHRDECGTRGTAGCEELRQALWRVRPRLAVCGHIHEARGVELVKWDLDSLNVKYKETETLRVPDMTGDSRKQFRVDLTAKWDTSLRNDGSRGDFVPVSRLEMQRGTEVIETGDATADEPDRDTRTPPLTPPRPKRKPPFPGFESAERPISPIPDTSRPQQICLATKGQGGPTSSSRCDQEALSGRRGRAETCFVNAAIMGTNWPHKAGRKFNKPVVIDLDLPIATGLEDEDAVGRTEIDADA